MKDSYTQKELLERGWTKKSIEMFLGSPDKIVKILYGKCHLYNIVRVEKLEQSNEFKTWFEKNKVKREKLKSKQLERCDILRKENLKKVESLNIKVKLFENDKLVDFAVKHYQSRNEYSHVDTNNREFLDRICVNYLRHCCSSYEWQLEKIFGKVGVSQLYVIVKTKVLEEIRKNYPHLSGEVDNQILRLTNNL